MPKTEIDKAKLGELIDAAITAQSAYDRALREIEQYVGQDIDDLHDIIETCDAESLLELIDEQEEEDHDATYNV